MAYAEYPPRHRPGFTESPEDQSNFLSKPQISLEIKAATSVDLCIWLQIFGPRNNLLKLRELEFVEAAVLAAQPQKIVMAALFEDLAVDQRKYAVGIADGGKTVGDDKSGPPRHEVVEGALDFAFRPAVKRGGGFVEDKYGSIF